MARPKSVARIHTSSDELNRVEDQLISVLAPVIKMDLAEMVSAPSSISSTGSVGQWAVDSSYFYVCVGLNSWKRAALSTW